MTSSKNPVREFIEILRRIRTGHENLKVSSGIPGFIPGTGERVDAFSTALPWESATPDGLFTLKGDKPENPEGLGFAIEIFPQTGVTSEMEKTLIGLAAPLEAGSVLSITAFASSAVRGIAELMVPEARVPDGFPPLSPEAEGIIDTATNWAAENLVKGAVEPLTPQAPVYPRHWRVWLTVVVPTTKPDDEEVREKVLTARRAISAVLEQAGLFMGVWDADVLVGTASEILNPQLMRSGDFVRPSANPFEPPSVQVMKADTEVTVEKHRIRFETLDRKSAVHAVGLGADARRATVARALSVLADNSSKAPEEEIAQAVQAMRSGTPADAVYWFKAAMAKYPRQMERFLGEEYAKATRLYYGLQGTLNISSPEELPLYDAKQLLRSDPEDGILLFTDESSAMQQEGSMAAALQAELDDQPREEDEEPGRVCSIAAVYGTWSNAGSFTPDETETAWDADSLTEYLGSDALRGKDMLLALDGEDSPYLRKRCLLKNTDAPVGEQVQKLFVLDKNNMASPETADAE